MTPNKPGRSLIHNPQNKVERRILAAVHQSVYFLEATTYSGWLAKRQRLRFRPWPPAERTSGGTTQVGIPSEFKLRGLNVRHTHQTIACYQVGKLGLTAILCTFGSHGNNHVSHVRRAIDDFDFDVICDFRSKLSKNRPRFINNPRPILEALVPSWRQPQEGSRIAGAKSTNNDVPDLLGVLENHKLRCRAGFIT